MIRKHYLNVMPDYEPASHRWFGIAGQISAFAEAATCRQARDDYKSSYRYVYGPSFKVLITRKYYLI
mgnify:CR=1 FL=1